MRQRAGVTGRSERRECGRTSICGRPLAALVPAAVPVVAVLVAALALFAVPAASARVLRVGSYNGIPGDFTSVQTAVDQAQPGDFVLIGPGDYHEGGHRVPPGAMGDDRAGAALLITTSGLHVRGMNRNGVMIDGTKPGSSQCSPQESAQDFGPTDASGMPTGRNGLVVFKASGTSVENLSVCNFPTGSTGGGNELWFDGGGSTGRQALGAFRGAYLSSTSTFYKDAGSPFANYGIYSSNTTGVGVFTQVYANNDGDAAYYIGACPNCGVILDNAHAQNSDLGYSGTNSGGDLIIQNSEFDNNQSGFVTNSQNNDDYPSPQDGGCPSGATGSEPAGTQQSHSCWVFENNSVHDNNNPNVPTSGAAAAGPVGTGVVISGGRGDIVTHNHIFNNGAWGVLLVPYPDTEDPPPEANPACVGGVPPNQPNPPAGQSPNGDPCFFDDFGNEIAGNTVDHNGSFGNMTNGDLAEVSNPESPGNCWHGNTDPAAGGPPTSDPPMIQQTHGTCGQPNSGDPASSPLTVQVACNSQFFSGLAPLPPAGPLGLSGSCPLPASLADYPRASRVQMAPLPAQASMPDPCLDVPQNPWCPNNPVNPPPYPVPGAPFFPGIFGKAAGQGGNQGPGQGASGACGGRRVLVLHLRRTVSARLRLSSVRVTANSRRVKVSRGGLVRINLRGLRRSTVVVHIRGRLTNGRSISQTRRYHPCTRGVHHRLKGHAKPKPKAKRG
jgi:hypothetical protein